MIPISGADRIAPPTPEPSPCMERCNRRGGDSTTGAGSRSQADGSGGIGGNNNNSAYVPRRLRGSDLSLTTITEEPPSWTSSHEIVVQPEVVVETTTCNGNSCNSSRSHSSDQVLSHCLFYVILHHSYAFSLSYAQSSASECSNSSSSSGGSSPPLGMTTTTTSSSHGRHFTTKVTATAKVKVEVHAPIHSTSVDPSSYYKHRRRRGDC